MQQRLRSSRSTQDAEKPHKRVPPKGTAVRPKTARSGVSETGKGEAKAKEKPLVSRTSAHKTTPVPPKPPERQEKPAEPVERPVERRPLPPTTSPAKAFVAAKATPQPPRPTPIFIAGDKAVHPAHGVGEVIAVEQRVINGTTATFYVLRILDNGMKVMVPTTAASQVGLRGIMDDAEASMILDTMRAREVAVDVQPWSRRFRIYTEMIKSGSPIEVAKVLRDMNRLKFDKDLSFGERRLLDQARSLLLKELALAKNKSESDMADEIKAIFSA